MKHLLLTTIAAVVLVGCGPSLSEFKDSQLRSAVKAGSIGDVKKAIANGANVNAMSFRSYGSLVKPPLHEAASRGHKEIAELLITAGADVKAKTDDGNTPLHSAAAKEHENIAELLIAKGADVNAKNKLGITPLDNAINHTETATLLRKHGGKTGEELKAEGNEKIHRIKFIGSVAPCHIIRSCFC